MFADWTQKLFILVCSFIRPAPCLDPANLTGKQTPPITMSSVLQGYYLCKAFAKNTSENRSQRSQDYSDVSLMIAFKDISANVIYAGEVKAHQLMISVHEVRFYFSL